ncbi:NADP-dependent oxidoreductase [Microbacterium sp. NPDC091313]
MKAARFSRFGAPDVLEIVDIPKPHPGPGEVRISVRAAGINASDAKKRQGLMDAELPQTLGYEAAGVVDEIGAGVVDVRVGDRVFGASPYGAAQAEYAVLSSWAPIPSSVDFAEAAAIPVAAETAARALDQLALAAGDTVFINGASGTVGSAAVQLAVLRSIRVIGSASAGAADLLRGWGAVPVAYGPGMWAALAAAAPDGVDAALDVAGNGVLPELVALTGSSDRVVTIADFVGARETGVRFSSGDSGRAEYVLAEVAGLLAAGRFAIRVGQTLPLERIADAHRMLESGAVRGKIVLAVST